MLICPVFVRFGLPPHFGAASDYQSWPGPPKSAVLPMQTVYYDLFVRSELKYTFHKNFHEK